MKKLEKLTLKEMKNELIIMDSKSCRTIQAGGDYVSTFDVESFLDDFYGNSTIRQLCDFADNAVNVTREFMKEKLLSLSEDQIMNAIEKVAPMTPLKYLEYMPAPAEWSQDQFGNSIIATNSAPVTYNSVFGSCAGFPITFGH